MDFTSQNLLRLAISATVGAAHHAACSAPTTTRGSSNGERQSEGGGESMSHDRYAFLVKPFLGLLSLSRYSMWTFIGLDGASRIFTLLRPYNPRPMLSSLLWPRSPMFDPTVSYQTSPTLPASFLAGASLVILGWRLRKACFDALGRHFTLTHKMFQKHWLVTSGPYSVVRHPGYIGMLAVRIGGLCVLLSDGSWARMVGAVPWPFSQVLSGVVADPAGDLAVKLGKAAIGLYAVHATLELIGLFCVRAPHEDAMLRGRFGAEWETYRENVPWMFIPHVL